ncbi:hypothetical protein [Kitasatospora griseola]|uniref:hypothetical protein n=1 Tax=Kitasatospora griseola TaxID=2064 RepID=UPI001671574A|nr:hypothetical protein [Kitasatospora griseola]
MSDDVDLFASIDRATQEMSAAVAAAAAAYEAAGCTVEVVQQVLTSTWMNVTDPATGPQNKVELVAEFHHPPLDSEFGPVLHRDGVAAGKTGALLSRAEVRELQDVGGIGQHLVGIDALLAEVLDQVTPALQLRYQSGEAEPNRVRVCGRYQAGDRFALRPVGARLGELPDLRSTADQFAEPGALRQDRLLVQGRRVHSAPGVVAPRRYGRQVVEVQEGARPLERLGEQPPRPSGCWFGAPR